MVDEVELSTDSRGKSQPRHADELIADLCGRQHGALSLHQLLGAGVSRRAIEWRLASGHLRRVHRCVYTLNGAQLSRLGRWKAATLVHPRAVLSYRSAAALWAIRASTGMAELTIPGSRPHRQSLRIHRDALAPDEATTEDAIPVTTPARTLLDLAAVLDAFSLERALHEAEFRRLTSPTSLPALLDRHPRRRGSVALRGALGSLRAGAGTTRSSLERRFLGFCRERSLPAPQPNVWLSVGESLIQVDCLWRDARLIVELDGRASHETSRAFEADRARDRSLQVLGFRVLRVTDRALRVDPDALERDLRALIG